MEFPFKTATGQVGAYITGLFTAAFWIIAGAPRNWAVTIPDAAHSYGIRMRSGVDLFFRPAIGWFIEHGFVVCVACLGSAVIAEVIARVLGGDRSSEPASE